MAFSISEGDSGEVCSKVDLSDVGESTHKITLKLTLVQNEKLLLKRLSHFECEQFALKGLRRNRSTKLSLVCSWPVVLHPILIIVVLEQLTTWCLLLKVHLHLC